MGETLEVGFGVGESVGTGAIAVLVGKSEDLVL